MQTHIGRTHTSSQTQCSCPSLYFPCLLAFVSVCVCVLQQWQKKPLIQLSMYMISLYLCWGTCMTLSLSLCIFWLVSIIILSLSLQNYSISLFFFIFLPPPACLSLAFSIPPSFPLHRLWLASVKPLKRKRIHICECVCACERACMSLCVCMYEVVLLGWIWTSPCLFCPGGLWNEKGSHCAADLHW